MSSNNNDDPFGEEDANNNNNNNNNDDDDPNAEENEERRVEEEFMMAQIPNEDEDEEDDADDFDEDDENEDGEDLMDNMERDYEVMPHLDQYEQDGMVGEEEEEEFDVEQALEARLKAEEEMNERDQEYAGGRGGMTGRALPRALDDDVDFMTVLVERDAASKSAREAPGVGELPGAAVKCTLVMGDENYDEVPPGGVDPETAPPAVFDESPLGAATSHIFLHRCLRAVSSEESMDRVRKAPLKFQQTVEELLHLTRPFSFF